MGLDRGMDAASFVNRTRKTDLRGGCQRDLVYGLERLPVASVAEGFPPDAGRFLQMVARGEIASLWRKRPVVRQALQRASLTANP